MNFKQAMVVGVVSVIGLHMISGNTQAPDSCYSKHGMSDSARKTTAMAVEYEYMRMGKSYLLEGKSTEDKIIMYCQANKG